MNHKNIFYNTAYLVHPLCIADHSLKTEKKNLKYYICKYIFVSYSWPNGWTKLANFFKEPMEIPGVKKTKKSISLFKIPQCFKKPRATHALQLVLYKTYTVYYRSRTGTTIVHNPGLVQTLDLWMLDWLSHSDFLRIFNR